MSTIKELINAANETSEYVNLMRMPKKGQSITKYAAIEFKGMKPKLEDTGFRMISKGQNTSDNLMAVASLLSSPFILMSGFNNVQDGMDMKQTLKTSMGGAKMLAGTIMLIGGTKRIMSSRKAETLVFPKAK